VRGQQRVAALICLAAACYPDPDTLRSRADPGGADGSAAPAANDGSPEKTDSNNAGSDGPGANPTDTGGSTQTAAEACAAYANANVVALNRCSPLVVQLLYGSLAVAQQRFRLLCRYAELPGSNFPRRPVEPCLAALRSLSCDDLFESGVPAACQAPGDYSLGTRCIGDDQCQSGFCDLSTPEGACGRCARPPGVGQPCSNGGVCASGLLCAASGTCAAPANLGGACGEAQPCRESLACPQGTCTRKGAPGAPCNVQEDCDLVNGVACNPSTRICIPLRVSMSCGFAPDGALVLCPAAGFCQALLGTCVPAAADGAACDDDAGPNCTQPATCTSGVCRLPPYDPICVR
jgi:hypothetical protein